MTFFAELKRRNVIRVGAAYVVAAWLVIQVVETIFPAFGFGDVAVRNTTIVFAIGFTPALIFAWAFELTPEGLKKESEVDRSQSVTPQTGKKLDRMIMVVLALGLAFFAFDKFVLHPQREAAKDEQVAGQVEQARQAGRTEALVESYGDKSIAVLPFVNMSSDEEQEYFSDGISEELLNLLAKIPELRVISRSSAFSFKGQNLEIPEIAQRLNVAHILEGSVRKSGNKIRITAQLIEARSDTHLWSETYALYLQARHLGRLGTAEGHERSIALYQQTLAIDPDYAPAHARLGWIAMRYDNDLAQAARHMERALQLDPNDIRIISNAAALLLDLGRLDEAIAINEYVAARDPVNPTSHFNLAASYRVAGRWDEAIASYETGLRLSPGRIGAHYFKGMALLFKGEFEAALESFTREEGYEGIARVQGQAIALYLLGRQEEHQAKLDELIERWGDQWPSEVAPVYAYMGDTDRAFEWLQKSVAEEEGGFNPADPLLQPLANDPRSGYVEVKGLKSLGLPA